MNAYGYLAGAIVMEVIGTSLMQYSQGFTRVWPSVVTVACYAVSFWLLAQTLKEIPTGVAYAIWSGCGIVLISLAAWVLRGQKLDAAALMGIGLIVAGVVVLNLFSKSAAH